MLCAAWTPRETEQVKEEGHLFSEEEYAKILDHLVIVCVDTLVVDAVGRALLGRRVKPPVQDWWIFGGRMSASESYTDAAKRGLTRELGLTAEGPFNLIGYYDLRWPTRAEKPYTNGCHLLLVAMKYALGPLDAPSLPLGEDSHGECRWFTKDEIRSTPLHPYLSQVLDDAGY